MVQSNLSCFLEVPFLVVMASHMNLGVESCSFS